MSEQSAREDAARAAYDEATRQFDILEEGWPDDCSMPNDGSVRDFTTAMDTLLDTILADIEEMQRLRAVVEAAAEYVAQECGDCGWQACDVPGDVECTIEALRAALKEVSE